MKISKALASDADVLTELTIRSKCFWGYGSEQIEIWRDELTISKDFIEENEVYIIHTMNSIAGFYAYKILDSITIKLEFLFIEPSDIGKGYGSKLVNDFLDRVKGLNQKRVILDSDPNAAKFYEKLGFKTIDKLPSSIEGRFLPVMELRLD